MRLDTRPVIDRLSEEIYASEVEDSLYQLETALDDAIFALGDDEDRPLTSTLEANTLAHLDDAECHCCAVVEEMHDYFHDRDHGKLIEAMGDSFRKFSETLDVYMGSVS